MRTTRWMPRTAIVLAMFGATTALVRADWVDTFDSDVNGGFDQAWTFTDEEVRILGNAGTYTLPLLVDGRLEFVANAPEATAGNADVFVVGLVGPDVPLAEPDPIFADVRLRGTVSAPANILTLAGGASRSNNNIFLLARFDGFSGYLLAIDYANGDVDLVRIDNGNVSAQPVDAGVIPGFNRSRSYVLEMTAIDQTISGFVFEVGSRVPLVDLTIDDGFYFEGWSGLGTAINANDDFGDSRTILGAAFDDVSSVSLPINKSIGDLTGDGFIAFDDLAVLLSNWDDDVPAGLGNLVDAKNTRVNFDDLAVLLSEWTGPDPAGSPQAVLAVPEPSSCLLAILGVLGLGLARSRRPTRRMIE